jgi:cytidylate kinase
MTENAKVVLGANDRYQLYQLNEMVRKDILKEHMLNGVGIPCMDGIMIAPGVEIAAGTTILPNAKVKIFLTASPEARAERRYKELVEKGESVTFDEVLTDMKKRDYDDAHRAASPLRKAEDAIEVDTGDLTLEQSIAKMKEVILENLGE